MLYKIQNHKGYSFKTLFKYHFQKSIRILLKPLKQVFKKVFKYLNLKKTLVFDLSKSMDECLHH